GKWSPVLYHGEMPKRVQKVITTEPVEIREDHEPSFGYLIKQFPPPQEEIKMVRPIEGFTTKDGKFFENEDEATIHEVVFELTGNFRDFVKETSFEQIDPQTQDYLILQEMQFISENEEAVQRSLNAIRNKQAAVRESETSSSEEGSVPVD